MAEPTPEAHLSSGEFRTWLEQEIRLAMQQESRISSGINRAAIAKVRASRIIVKLQGESMVDLTEIPMSVVREIAKQLAPPGAR